MPLIQLKLKPGIDREVTDFSGEGGYWDCDKVRFRAGYPEKIGGWTLYSASEFWGVCRSWTAFRCNCGAILSAFGTNLKFYVESGGNYNDVTPIQDTNTLASNAFTTDTATPTVIYVNDAGYSPGTNDFVTISGASDFNGVPAAEINGEHQVTSVSATQYKFTITTVPTSSGTGGSCTAAYQVVTGNSIYTLGTGWGASTWSRSTWGSGATVGVGQQLRIWNVDNYGEDLIFGPRGGGLYYWAYDAGAGLTTRGELISGMVGANYVPTYQNYILVSDQSRFVVTLGSNDYGSADADPMLVRWSDQENYLEWEPTALTQAGSQILSIGSQLITAVQTRQEILIWSDAALFSMQYLGPPYVFGFNTLADNISIMGPNARIAANNAVYWMGANKFYVYNGQAQVLPCSVRSYIFGRLNKDQAWQVTAGHVEKYSEIWWFYTSTGAYQNDSYVVFNYLENTWYYGSMSRSVWDNSGLKANPVAAVYNDSTQKGQLYYQEYGVDDNTTAPATAIAAYAETSDFDIGEGENFGLVNRIIPDLTFDGSTASSPVAVMTLTPRRFPGSNYGTGDANNVARTATVPVEQFTEQVFVRVRGRQMKFRIASTGTGVAWRLGTPRLQMRPDGRK